MFGIVIRNPVALCLFMLVSSATAQEVQDPQKPVPIFARGDEPALHRGVYEVSLSAPDVVDNPYFKVDLHVVFTRPGGSSVQVDGFYDGDGSFKARAYCDSAGTWTWQSKSYTGALNNKSGRFDVLPSRIKGKLRVHPEDSTQFAYDNGTWFLHIGDTGYRYVVDTEPEWQTYIDQAATMGATKIRTWFARSRSTVEALFNGDRSELNLAYWQQIDRRLRYALERHPDLQFQLIPYAEDTEEIKRYAEGDPAARLVARYAQARWSAFPNVQWAISNDREIVHDEPMAGRMVDYKMIDEIGYDMAAREAWGTLLTNHQARYSGYDFLEAPWSDIVTLEDLDQVTGFLISDYRRRTHLPVVLDEDRYEHWRNPEQDRYYFRRLMWASLLSGGHATYGGLQSWEAYDSTMTRGVRGYLDANEEGLLEQGAHDFIQIHRFFRDRKLTLAGLKPDDELTGNDPYRWKAIHDEDTYILYLANPDGDEPGMDGPSPDPPSLQVTLPTGSFEVRWFNPRTGLWYGGEEVRNGTRTLSVPDYVPDRSGDWVVLIQRD